MTDIELASQRGLTPGAFVRHFKRETLSKEELKKNPLMYLYQIVGIAEHTESKEMLMVYRALYGKPTFCARPLSMFMSEVEKDKYPYIKQKYRFEADSCPCYTCKCHCQNGCKEQRDWNEIYSRVVEGR
jgi:hypothetical protein